MNSSVDKIASTTTSTSTSKSSTSTGELQKSSRVIYVNENDKIHVENDAEIYADIGSSFEISCYNENSVSILKHVEFEYPYKILNL